MGRQVIADDPRPLTDHGRPRQIIRVAGSLEPLLGQRSERFRIPGIRTRPGPSPALCTTTTREHRWLTGGRPSGRGARAGLIKRLPREVGAALGCGRPRRLSGLFH
jgi:hypothetical protein